MKLTLDADEILVIVRRDLVRRGYVIDGRLTMNWNIAHWSGDDYVPGYVRVDGKVTEP